MNTINLYHALRATRTAELHFTAYTRYLPAAAELARQCDEPEWEDYDADEAQESSDTILTLSQEIITGMKQHRACCCAGLPAARTGAYGWEQEHRFQRAGAFALQTQLLGFF